MSEPFNLKAAVTTYYLLLEMGAKPSSVSYKKIVNLLYDLFEDYLPLACIGEARHGYGSGDYYILEIQEVMNAVYNEDRSAVQKACLKFNPQQFMPILHELFEKNGWSSGFGGSSWAKIAMVWLRRKELPKDLWVHQVSDLAHNNGYCFDKALHMVDFDSFEYALIMTIREKVSLIEGLQLKLLNPIQVAKIGNLSKLKTLLGTEYELVELIDMPYNRLQWGTCTISNPILVEGKHHGENEDEDEYTDEEEDNEDAEKEIIYPVRFPNTSRGKNLGKQSKGK